MLPLQTSGLLVETWVPPKTRFVTYEKRDEEWARFCGIGHVKTEPAPLYDVRDEQSELIGYTKWNPVDQVKTGNPYMRLHVFEDLLDRFDYQWPSGKVRYKEIKVRDIEVRIGSIGFSVSGDFCEVWRARLQDAESLVRCGFIECLGEDNMEKFCRELRRRAWAKMDRHLMQVVR